MASLDVITERSAGLPHFGRWSMEMRVRVFLEQNQELMPPFYLVNCFQVPPYISGRSCVLECVWAIITLDQILITVFLSTFMCCQISERLAFFPSLGIHLGWFSDIVIFTDSGRPIRVLLSPLLEHVG